MRKYLPYIRKYWYCFALGPLFMMLEACGEFILPFMNANIIDRGAANGDTAYILQNGLWMALIALAMLLTGVLGAFFAVRGAARVAAGVRKDVFERVQSFAFSDIDRFSTGSLITRTTNDITQIQTFIQTLMRGFIRSPIMIVGALVMSFRMNPELAWVILVVVPILALAIGGIVRATSPRYTAMQAQLDRLNSGIGETITNEKVIKSFVREGHEKDKFKVINETLRDRTVSALKRMILLQPISALAVNVTTLVVVWIAGRRIMVGGMAVGTLTAFITYLSQVLTALNFMANIFLQGTRAAASDRRVSEVIDTVPAIRETGAGRSAPISGAIELRHVTFRYFKDAAAPVLDDVCLSIAPGELVGIIGSTGSGKSTLVSLIPRLYDPDAGEVLVDGVNVKDYGLRALREGIAMVLQKNTLFSGTIAENLRWGDEEADDARLAEVCAIAQADDFIRAFPEGYETELAQGGANLSGGQRQRLCIARALLKRPEIIILDDSTSAVDTATDAAIRRALRERLPGVTKLIIAQRISSVMDADKIVVMDRGRVVAVGVHEALLRDCAAYQEIYYSQREREEDAHE